QYQADAKELILAGLEEHWGVLDPTKNPDLDDIAASYAGEIFILAKRNGKIVGTGAVVQEDEQTGRVVRMSVTKEMRRYGIGSRILEALCTAAQKRGYKRLVLETTTGWQDAEAFYQRFGFKITGYAGEDTNFEFCF
ncbi:MAG: N-acetyltransferase, partial [Chloroflexi bacterium]